MAGTAEQKARGAFFTPKSIACYLARWAVRDKCDSILEPSCGEAVFLAAAGEVLSELGAATLVPSGLLHGVELHEESARLAGEMLRANGLEATIEVGDFFEHAPSRQFDAILGNPPFIRYQDFTGLARTRSMEAALAQGVRLSGLASSWAELLPVSWTPG